MANATYPPILDTCGQDIVDGMQGVLDAMSVTPAIATSSTPGIVKVDGTSIQINSDGVISAPHEGSTFVQIPTVTGTSYTYNGGVKQPTISNLDTDHVSVLGTTSATNAGSYTITFALKDAHSCVWTDRTTANKSTDWSIAKASQAVAATSTSVSVSSGSPTATVTISGYATTLSCSVSDSTVASASLNGSVLTITGLKTGIATVSVVAAETANYSAGAVDITVDAQMVPMKTFAAATDAEIAQMVAAADAGQIDLYEDCGWRVGQEHQTTISAIAASGTYDGVSWSVGESQPSQTITLVLMHRGLYQLVTPVLNKNGTSRSTCSFVVGVKNCLSTGGYMNSTATSAGSWQSSARRGWCNGGFRSAISSDLEAVFKRFTCITGTYNGEHSGGANITTQDYFALFGEKEIFGSKTYSTDKEAAFLTQVTWYKTTSNRRKTLGDSGSVYTWWERSPYDYNSICFCGVTTNGAAHDYNASYGYGLSPFGCI